MTLWTDDPRDTNIAHPQRNIAPEDERIPALLRDGSAVFLIFIGLLFVAMCIAQLIQWWARG